MQLFSDQCVYIRHIRNNVIIIRVHVDDMLVLASDNKAMAEFKKYGNSLPLASVFKAYAVVCPMPLSCRSIEYVIM